MKIIVAHPAQQHSYRLSIALNRIGYLNKYVTTVYCKKPSFTYFICRFLSGELKKKAQQRHCKELDDLQVVQFCECEGLFKLLCMYFKPLKKFYKRIKYHTADRFAKKVAKYAIKNNVDMVITYDDSSPIMFEILKKKAPHIKRVLDVSAANRLYMRNIYDKDIELAPSFAERLKSECSIVWDDKSIDRNIRELASSQWFIVPSKFVSNSLKFSGINDERIIFCPYGVDISMFQCKTFAPPIKPVRFVYVGVPGEYKGISYLMKAFEKVSEKDANLTIIGSHEKKDNLLKNTSNVRFIGRILHSNLPRELSKYDVFVFPSLGDSFSLSAMEAAACGLPLIVTENTGMCDCVTDGIEGFIIPPQSSDALLDKIMWYVNHRDRIKAMGVSARKMAEHFSWEKYYSTMTIRIKELGEVR